MTIHSSHVRADDTFDKTGPISLHEVSVRGKGRHVVYLFLHVLL